MCLSGKVPSGRASSFSAALVELESGVTVELRNGFKALPGNSPPNVFMLPQGMPSFDSSAMAVEHRRLLLQPFSVETNLKLSDFYATEFYAFALRCLEEIPSDDPERNQWVAAETEAKRICTWIVSDAKRWTAIIQGSSGAEIRGSISGASSR